MSIFVNFWQIKRRFNQRKSYWSSRNDWLCILFVGNRTLTIEINFNKRVLLLIRLKIQRFGRLIIKTAINNRWIHISDLYCLTLIFLNTIFYCLYLNVRCYGLFNLLSFFFNPLNLLLYFTFLVFLQCREKIFYILLLLIIFQ